MKKIRWGILGCGNIAKKFAAGLTVIPDAELVAVGSRSQEKADAFANEFGATRRHASYEALAADAQVDAIYVATPHVFHRENSILCMEHGKAVLCEKPISINAADTQAMIDSARANKVFLMEAMWTRFLPTMTKLRELLAAGTIGDVRMIIADFGFRSGFNPQGRLFDPALGGGGLLDVGVYSVSFTSMVMGGKAPLGVVSQAEIGATGIDEQAAWILNYEDARLGIGYSAVRTGTPHEATVLGTDGRIRAEAPFWSGEQLTVTAGGKTETLTLPKVGNGYNYQAVEVMNCLRAGKLESEIMPLAESLQIQQTMERIRAPWGLVYPSEK